MKDHSGISKSLSNLSKVCFLCSCASRFMVFLLLLFIQARPASSQDAIEGKALFYEEKKCNICHSIGGGKMIGPDLKGVTEIRDREWLIRHIVEPDKMIAEKDPIVMQLLAEHNNAAMPVFGLNRKQAISIITFLENPDVSESGSSQMADSAVVFSIETILPDVAQEEIISTGALYFNGRIKFENGAPACVSCHHVTQSGLFGGGTLGPELTPAYQKFTGQGLASLMSSVPYPTMSPLFDKKALTEEEKAFLVGYLKYKNTQSTLSVAPNVGVFTVLGFIVLLFLAPMIWHNRLGSVRKKLLREN